MSNFSSGSALNNFYFVKFQSWSLTSFPCILGSNIFWQFPSFPPPHIRTPLSSPFDLSMVPESYRLHLRCKWTTLWTSQLAHPKSAKKKSKISKKINLSGHRQNWHSVPGPTLQVRRMRGHHDSLKIKRVPPMNECPFLSSHYLLFQFCPLRQSAPMDSPFGPFWDIE